MQQRLMSPDLIHVAAANENCGRVVLAMPGSPPNAQAIDTAVTVARAFEASLETLLIECPDALELTSHSFAREISYAGRIRTLRVGDVAHGQGVLSRSIEHAVQARVAGRGVEHMLQRVQAPMHEAVLAACQRQGPWNMVVLGEAMSLLKREQLRSVLAGTHGATGLVVVGTEAAPAYGDVIVVVDDIERFGQIVRAAQRLAAVLARGKGPHGVVRLLLAAATQGQADELEGLVRLALPAGHAPGGVEIVIDPYRANYGTHAEVAEQLRRLKGGFVVARLSSAVLPSSDEADMLSGVLRAPLLLVR
jgi:hypothetical protein